MPTTQLPFTYTERCLDNDADIEKQLPLAASLALRRARRYEKGLCGRVFVKQRQAINNQLTQSQSIATPSDSWVKVYLPFAKQPALRSRYQLFDTNRIRVGRVLEDCDAIAGDCAYRHQAAALGLTPLQSLSTLTIVTLALDRFTFLHAATLEVDLCYEAVVTWVGISSIEIRVDLSTVDSSHVQQHIGHVVVLMVARHVKTYEAAPFSPLTLSNDTERELFEIGVKNRQRRQLQASTSLDKMPPSAEEVFEEHQLYLAHKAGVSVYNGAPVVPMRSTRHQSTIIMQGQERNIHNKIFGGALMRFSFELAYATVHLITKGTLPFLIEIDDIYFLKPVPIGSICVFNSEILCSDVDKATMQVFVDAAVIEPKTGIKETTNQFYFTFKIDTTTVAATQLQTNLNQHSTVAQTIQQKFIPFIMPESYEEMMAYIEGRRREKRRIQTAYQ